MASTSEVGHAKNVAHLATLIIYCQGYGTTYNPSNNAIKIPQLTTLLTNAQTALANVINDATANTNAINARLVAFQNIKKLSTRMYNALIASGATAQQKANAKTINRKIQGSRAKITPPSTTSQKVANTNVPPVVDATNNNPPIPVNPVIIPNPISVSQQSYDNLIQHFAAFIALLVSIPSYNPNEVDLKIASLNTYQATLIATNNAAVIAHTKIGNTRILRNKILYTPVTGLCDIGNESKGYIKSIYGSSAPEYKQLSGLSFITRKL